MPFAMLTNVTETPAASRARLARSKRENLAVPTQLTEKERLIGNFIGYVFLVFFFVVLSPIAVGIVVFAPLQLVARYGASPIGLPTTWGPWAARRTQFGTQCGLARG
jgi:hypothetical protein